MTAHPMVEIWRGPVCESLHLGHAVVCGPDGTVVEAWGTPETPVLPRSSSKMIQALPLVESGAADAAGLEPPHLALACASHQGAAIHTERVSAWLAAQGLGEEDLRCGPQPPRDETALHAMIRAGGAPGQIHNNCSGKHAGFLTLARHLGGGPEYLGADHPVQRAVREAWEEVTGEAVAATAVDGCSAPNHATSLTGLSRAMAHYAEAGRRSGVRAEAQARLVAAMAAHPELVAGEGRACTALIRAMGGADVVKTGAEGVFVGILPTKGLGIALKIADGATRAAEAAMVALLVRHGALDGRHPTARAYLDAPIRNWRGLETGRMRALL